MALIVPKVRHIGVREDLTIDGLDFTVRGHDRDETGYPVNC